MAVKLFSFSGILNKIFYRHVGKYIFCWSHSSSFDRAKNAFGNTTIIETLKVWFLQARNLLLKNQFLKYQSR